MSAYYDIERYREEEATERLIEDQHRHISESPVIYYLAHFGDAIEERVQHCRTEANELASAGFEPLNMSGKPVNSLCITALATYPEAI
ncbi:MAG: hypothetical protein M1608_00360 [Candidatus Omnitrophica bacterium]|nr:hypothetical protein [Candidatus Omnitrophota bacterium]